MSDEARPVPIWNPRYLVYARTHGRSAEEQRAHDEEAWPGGRNVGFSLWIKCQWHVWFNQRQPKLGPEDWFFRTAYAKEFDDWLNTAKLERLPDDP